MLLDFLGHLRFGDRLVELGQLGRALIAFAELFLDRAHLLAQQMLAVRIADRLARFLVDLARDLEHLDAMREQLEQLVEPRLQIERLEQRLFFLGADVHQAGDQVREARRPLDLLQRRDHFLGYLRQQLQNLRRALPEGELAPFDVRVDRLRIGNQLYRRDRERIAVEELQHAKALHAPANRVMRPVGRRDVAQHVGGRADPMHVARTRLFDVNLALQQHAERTLQAHRFLHGGDRTLAPDPKRNDHPGKQHHVAHGNDDHRVLGQRTRRSFPACRGLGRGCDDLRAAVGGHWLGGIRQSGFFVHDWLDQFIESQHDATVDHLVRAGFDAHARKRNAPLEEAVRNLELPDGMPLIREGQPPFAAHHEHAGLADDLDAIGRDARHRDHDEDLVLVLEDVDRRLP